MPTSNSWSTRGLWVLKVLVALLFLAAGTMKLVGPPMTIQEFEQVGLGQGFRIFTGLSEVTGALLLLAPAASSIGAGLLFCVSTGALIAQATRLHMDVIHTIVLMGITALLVWAGRRNLPWLRTDRPSEG